MTLIYIDFSGHVMVGFHFFVPLFWFYKNGTVTHEGPEILPFTQSCFLRSTTCSFKICMLADTKDFVRASPANSLQKIPNVVAESPFECQLWMVKPSR
jgi:hypothetical protein